MIYPAFVYKAPGVNQCQGGSFDYVVVNDDEERADKLANGWFGSIPEALKGESDQSEEAPADEESEPTRAELEAKATELGIAFDGRTSDAKLLGKITEALKGE